MTHLDEVLLPGAGHRVVELGRLREGRLLQQPRPRHRTRSAALRSVEITEAAAEGVAVEPVRVHLRPSLVFMSWKIFEPDIFIYNTIIKEAVDITYRRYFVSGNPRLARFCLKITFRKSVYHVKFSVVNRMDFC